MALLDEPVNEKKATEKVLFINGIQQLRIELQSQKVHSLVMASYERGEGKTVAIVALAKSMAQAGKKVLVIDGNYVSASLTEQLSGNDGLSPLLGTTVSSATLKKQITDSAVPGISILGIAASAATPVGLADTIAQILEVAKSNPDFDCVLIEVGALKYHVDGLEVLASSEAVATIHAANNVLNIAAIESMQRVQQYGKNYLGAVLNKVEMDVLEM